MAPLARFDLAAPVALFWPRIDFHGISGAEAQANQLQKSPSLALPNAVMKRQDPLNSDASVDAQMGIAWSAVSASKLSTLWYAQGDPRFEQGE